MRYERVIAEVLGMPWAVHPGLLATIAEVVALRASGHRFTDEEIEARVSAGQARALTRGGDARSGSIAVMPIIGTLLPRAEALEQSSGAISVQQLTARFQQLVRDDTVAGIVLDVDSGGGSVGGVEEFSDEIYRARAVKPVIALAAPMMASAAYWLGASASELMVTPSALVGSVGVYSAHHDISAAMEKLGMKVTLISAGKRKVTGNEFEPLSDEAREQIQAHVDAFYGSFVRDLARGRGVSQKSVRDGFGEGDVVHADEAVKLGMADRIGTLNDAITLAAKRAGVKPRAATGSAARVVGDEVAAHRLRMAERGV